jgi:hypothetical protein
MHLAVEILAGVALGLAGISLIPHPAEKPYWAYLQGVGLGLLAVCLIVIGAH